MRAMFVVQGLVSEDSDQIHRVLDDKVVFDDTSARASTRSSSTYTLAASASAVPVVFNGVTAASLIYLKASAPIQVRVNSNTAPLFDVRPILSVVSGGTILSASQQFDQPGVFFLTGKITSFFMTNPSATTAAQVSVFLLGEAA